MATLSPEEDTFQNVETSDSVITRFDSLRQRSRQIRLIKTFFPKFLAFFFGKNNLMNFERRVFILCKARSQRQSQGCTKRVQTGDQEL